MPPSERIFMFCSMPVKALRRRAMSASRAASSLASWSLSSSASAAKDTRAVGPILGPIICLEALAFFREAGFVGILIYAEGRVSKRVAIVATRMVALGAVLSPRT